MDEELEVVVFLWEEVDSVVVAEVFVGYRRAKDINTNKKESISITDLFLVSGFIKEYNTLSEHSHHG